MFFRSIQKFDYPAVDGLLMQLHEVDREGRPDLFAPADHYFSRESFETLLENDNIIAFLAQEGLHVLGCCFVSLLDQSSDIPFKVAYIDLLVVDKDHRRRGIGKAMFREVRRRARSLGAQKVELMVWSHNRPAVKAYESYGMTSQRSIYEISV